MNIQLGSIICWCNHSSTEIGSLSSVSEVGIGLFLALAVVQVVGSGGIAKLRRKTQLLRELVSTNRLDGERGKVAALDAALLQLELRLERLSGWLFGISIIAVVLCLVGLVVVSLMPLAELNCLEMVGFMAFHLLLPLVIFWRASAIIRRRCEDVRVKFEDAQSVVLERLLDD